MERVKIDFENCYGIKRLKCEFDFTAKSTYAIYAPNGVMKTSFAKTFLDFSNEQDSIDAIFKDRKTKRRIENESRSEVGPEEVFVILPYNQDFKSQRISTLLVNKSLKEKYEQIHSNINIKKEELLIELGALSGLKYESEETFSLDFTNSDKDFFKALLNVKTKVLNRDLPLYNGIVYQKIFNERVIKFLETKDFRSKLAEYIKIYNKLIAKSTYFKKGVFNHNNAFNVTKNLTDNGFFKANHSVTLNGKNKKKTITTEVELDKVIQLEKDSILKNPELVKAFEDIDKAITKNQELRSFRDYIEKNESLIPDLADPGSLKQKL